MKCKHACFRKSIGIAALSAVLGFSSASADAVNLVQNGSFEETLYSGTRAQYGYVVKNTTVYGSVPGWTYSPTNYVSDAIPSIATDYGYGTTLSTESFGVNTGDFDGEYALFIQRPGTVSQTVSGLTPGETYTYSFRYNARCSGVMQSKIQAKAGNFTLLNNNAKTRDSFYDYEITFRADKETMDLSFANTYMTTNSVPDNTLLIDGVRLTAAAADNPWSCSGTSNLWLGDATSGVDSSKTYSHTLNFGGAVADQSTLNGVPFKGIKSAGKTDRYSVTQNFNGVYGADGALRTIFGDSNAGSKEMANGFFYSLSGVTLSGLEPGVQYTTTFYLASWDTVNRTGYITAPDGTMFGLDENKLRTESNGRAGGLVSWTGCADEDGNLKFNFSAQNSDTLHVYGVSNAVTPGQTPDTVKTNLLFATNFGGPNGDGYEGMKVCNTVADVANFISPVGGEKWQVRGYKSDIDKYSIIENGALRTAANNANMMEIDSSRLAGKWVDLSLDLKINTLQGNEKERARGIGIGFSADNSPRNAEAGIGFSGLVLSPDGDLMFYENAYGKGVSEAAISNSIKYLAEDGSDFDKNDWYNMNLTLAFSEDGETATLIGVGIEGSIADYSPLLGLTFETTDLFTILSSSANSYDFYGLVDNIRMTEYVPEPSAWALLLLGAGSLFAIRRKNR